MSCFSHLLNKIRSKQISRRFSGDESFITTSGNAAGLDAGAGLGMVVERREKKKNTGTGALSSKGARL